MKNKGVKAQISVFIIIALVLGSAAGLTYFFSKSSGQNNSANSPVYDYVQACINDATINGIRYISFQGGYYDVPETSVNYGFSKVPYYFNLGEKQVPSKTAIERELSKYIEKQLISCHNNSDLEKQGYDLDFGKATVRTSLGKEVKVNVNYPIKITKGNKVSDIKDFTYSKEFDFDRLYSLIVQFSDEHQKNPDSIPIGYLPIFAKENNFKFYLIYISDNEVVYSFIFNDLIRNESISYNFGAKYKWEQPEVIEKKVEIEQIGYQHVFTGKEFSYQVKAKGNNIRFMDYSDLFDIDSNGRIRFITRNDQSGSYEILIKAYDDLGNSDETVMQLDIEKVTEYNIKNESKN